MAADLPLTWAFNPRLFPTFRVMFRTRRKSLNLTASFGRRLSESDTDQWWSHDGSKEGTDAAVAQAAQVYIKHGRPVLMRIAEPDSPLNSFMPEDLGKRGPLGFRSTKPRQALALAELRLSQGKRANAKAFAE